MTTMANKLWPCTILHAKTSHENHFSPLAGSCVHVATPPPVHSNKPFVEVIILIHKN